MLGPLIKFILGVVSFLFTGACFYFLYLGFGVWGTLLVVLAAALVVYLLIRFGGTPEPEGGWWLVRVRLKNSSPIRDEGSMSLSTAIRCNEPMLEPMLEQKAAFLLDRQMFSVTGGDKAAYRAHFEAGVLDQEAWLNSLGQDPSRARKNHPGYVHYLSADISRKGEPCWQALASLERAGRELQPQLDGLLAAVFDCLGRGETKAEVEIAVREHQYAELLKEHFADGQP